MGQGERPYGSHAHSPRGNWGGRPNAKQHQFPEWLVLPTPMGTNGGLTMTYHGTTSRKPSKRNESIKYGKRTANIEEDRGWLMEWT